MQEKIWRSRRFQTMALSFVVGTGLMAVKFVAYSLTGSTGVLSDALESIINVAASGFALYSVFLSRRPADWNHPYGHGKIEYFSAGFEGALICLAALAIFAHALPQFFDPAPLYKLRQGSILVLVATGINLALAGLLIRVGRSRQSLALVADGKHLLADVLTSAGVLLGLVLVQLTGQVWIDPLVACLVALNILFTGYRLLRESVGRLMDEAEPGLLQEIVDILNASRRSDWIAVRQLRARRYGPMTHIDLRLVLPSYYDLKQAQQVRMEVKQALSKGLQGPSEITVHLDPCTAYWCPQCPKDSCPRRISPSKHPIEPFDVAKAVSPGKGQLETVQA